MSSIGIHEPSEVAPAAWTSLHLPLAPPGAQQPVPVSFAVDKAFIQRDDPNHQKATFQNHA